MKVEAFHQTIKADTTSQCAIDESDDLKIVSMNWH
jgi:hypothetical protein